MDGYIQYVDFLTYLHNVFYGENAIAYTFGKTLGGSNIAVFSYYLASPFNVLLLFFKNINIHVFYNLVVALKLALASATFAYFSVNRFAPKSTRTDNYLIFIVLAMGYGLGQYSLAQASNIMWLDGVYMLPLMMIQCFYLAQGMASFKLPIIVGLTIIFNWYTAAIDCIYSGFYFVFELILVATASKYAVRKLLSISAKYVIFMLLGVMLSAILFLPTIASLKRSSRGSLSFDGFSDLSLLGEVPSIIQKYTYGATSQLGSVALFCGSLALVLAIFSIADRRVYNGKKFALLALMAASLAFVYWHPFFTMFSMLKNVGSYHYRYSYVAIFTLLFLAHVGNEAIANLRQEVTLRKVAVIFALLLLLLYYIKPINVRGYVYATAFFCIFETLLFSFLKCHSFQRKSTLNLVAVIFMLVAVGDLVINANVLLKNYSVKNVSAYHDYRRDQTQLITTIKEHDSSFYRISQTSPIGVSKDTKLTANYNEALSYNYASISGYTSSPDDNQRRLLSNLGYTMMGDNMCITNTSILAADSLLGVKYLLSDFYIKGYKELKHYEGIAKVIYENPFAMPTAFVYRKNSSSTDFKNPFEFQNVIFKELFGINEDLYTPLEYGVQKDAMNKHLKFTLNTSELSDAPVYANLPWNGNMEASMFVNGQFITKYACWLSPSVFYMPCIGKECVLEARADQLKFKMDAVQFYALDLERLKLCSAQAWAHKPTELQVENGKVLVRVEHAVAGERLFLSIPADEGWEISVNDHPARVELVGGCLYSIELQPGENSVRMKYHVKYLRAGICVSVFSLLILLAMKFRSRLRKQKRNSKLVV